jgi:hypothetical protein
MSTNIQVIVQEEDPLIVRTSLFNETFLSTIDEIENVDASELENGSVLVYKTNTNKWTATRLLDLQTVEAGEF